MGYQDQGPKQLGVVREGNALRVAREELLFSTLLSEPPSQEPSTADLSGGRFLMLVPHAKTLQVVLGHRLEVSWARPRVREISRSGMVLRDLDESRLPEALRAWKGKRLNLLRRG